MRCAISTLLSITLAAGAAVASPTFDVTSAERSIYSAAQVFTIESVDEEVFTDSTVAASGTFDRTFSAIAATGSFLAENTTELTATISPTRIEGSGSLATSASGPLNSSMTIVGAAGDALLSASFTLTEPAEVRFVAAIEEPLEVGVALVGGPLDDPIDLGIGALRPGVLRANTDTGIDFTGVLQPGDYLVLGRTTTLGLLFPDFPFGLDLNEPTARSSGWSFTLEIVPAPASAAPLLGLGVIAGRRRR